MAQPKNTTATLNYYLDPSKGGAEVLYIGTVGEKRRKHDPRSVTITDMRGSKEKFEIDIHGFQLVERESPEKLFVDDARIKDVYYPDCVDLIKKFTGATKVICTGHIVRRQSWKQAFEAEKDLDDMARSKGPSTANFVHVDMSYQGACDRVKNLEKDFSSDNCRWGMMNIWRPIERPVTRSALTMCDARSVRESDLVEVKAEFPKVPIAEEDKENHVPKGGKDPYSYRESFGTWHVRAPKTPDDHKWYYASEMKPEEVLLLKIYDSKMEGVARRSPHTAFESEKDWGPERQSLEVRCIVAWEDQKS